MIIILLAALETWPDTPLACRMPASLRSISLWSLIQSRANNPADSFCSHQSGLDYSLSYAPTRRWNVCCIFPEDGRRCCIKSASAEVRWKWKGMSGKNGFPEGTGFSPPEMAQKFHMKVLSCQRFQRKHIHLGTPRPCGEASRSV